ncbi:MAG: hypothetical protein NUW21_02015, partial [Elusimicrobia bacterium]|nr:hypothetical protein [Elusimicrobiota bacterium]
LQLKGEVLEKLEKVKHLNQKAYNEIVDETSERFGRVKDVGAAELNGLASDLKGGWSAISKELK